MVLVRRDALHPSMALLIVFDRLAYWMVDSVISCDAIGYVWWVVGNISDGRGFSFINNFFCWLILISPHYIELGFGNTIFVVMVRGRSSSWYWGLSMTLGLASSVVL